MHKKLKFTADIDAQKCLNLKSEEKKRIYSVRS